MKHERIFLIYLSLLRDFKLKHREKMFSQYLLSVYYLLDIFFLYWNILSNLCKMITLEIAQKVLFFGPVVFCKTPAGDYTFSPNVQQDCRASTRKYTFRNTLKLSGNVAQSWSLLSSVLGKSICINEQVELNIAKEN